MNTNFTTLTNKSLDQQNRRDVLDVLKMANCRKFYEKLTEKIVKISIFCKGDKYDENLQH